MAANGPGQSRLTFPPRDAQAFERVTHKFTAIDSAVSALPENYPEAEPGTNQWTVPSSNNPGWADRVPDVQPLGPADWMNAIGFAGKGIEIYPERNQPPHMGLLDDR